jgi:hypothetical protein
MGINTAMKRSFLKVARLPEKMPRRQRLAEIESDDRDAGKQPIES